MNYELWKTDGPKRCVHCGQKYQKEVFATLALGKKGISMTSYYVHENCLTLENDDRGV